MSLASYRHEGLLIEGQSSDTKAPCPNTELPTMQMLVKKEDITVIQWATPYGPDDETVLSTEYFPPPKKKSEKVLRKFEKYAVLIRKIVTRHPDRDEFLREELCIQSPELCKDLRSIVGDTYDSFDIKATPIVIPAPYFELFFKRAAIEKFMEDPLNAARKAEVELLNDFIRNDKRTVQNVGMYNAMVKQGKINFDTLWTLYPPNERLYRNDGAAPECWECWICRDIKIDPKKPLLWWIIGVRLDYDGYEIGLTKKHYPISFLGRVDRTMDIADLPLIPESYVASPRLSEMKKRLIERGRMFREIMGQDLDGHAYRSYRGPLWDLYDLDSPPKAQLKERVMVDYKEYLGRHAENTALLERREKTRQRVDDPDSGSNGQAPPDAEDTENRATDVFERFLSMISAKYRMENMDALLLLCPARIPAYGLRTKEWGWVLLERLHPVRPNGEAFESLRIDSNMKGLVKSLVEGHHSGTVDSFDDFTTGKGKGLVILLHGDPGVGKTLTAESIAGLYGSPLYSVSGGELSVDVTKVEPKLHDVFSLGKRWKAIVLLDEADVVMSKRESTELERNAIVAVWLRMLEYFEGVLFLTSNRLKDFDDAFRSRVHLTIHLPKLECRERAKIWEGLIRLNKQATDESCWTEEVFQTLGKFEINGRVIKNLLRTAMYHARSTSGAPTRLSPAHLHDVIKVELSNLETFDKFSKELERLLGTGDKSPLARRGTATF